jgi:hypothetical protein
MGRTKGWERGHRLVAALAITLSAACSSSSGGSSSSTSSSTSSSGAGGHGGSGGHSGHGGATTGTGGSGGACHGDAASWAALTQAPVACTSNADCCVIINGCLSEAQVVSADNQAAAKTAWPYCESLCNDCIPPAIVVGCENGECAAKVVDFADASPDLLMDHCGVDPVVGLSSVKLHFGCGGG